MRYIPHSKKDVQGMLQSVGIDSVDDLFNTIPKFLRLGRPLNLPEPLDEFGLQKLLQSIADSNKGATDPSGMFIGAGAHAHHIPSAVDQLLLRGEFFTAYTPYQAEVSQGTLQAIFEYQSMMAELLGVDVVNASMYDGASATAEAMLMALRIKRKKPGLLASRALHPEVRLVCETYLSEHEPAMEEIPFGNEGTTDLKILKERLDEKTAALVVQQPNALGCLEPLDEISSLVHDAQALLIVVVMEPISLGLLKAPGALGADIVTGEGMGLGSGLNFGGPGLGLFGTCKKNVWQMPGRLVGETQDKDGNRGFVLTMSSREQHIRRARATSNICTNEGLCVLAAAIHLSLLGKRGFTEIAETNAANAQQVKSWFSEAGVKALFDTPFFNEFCVQVEGDMDAKLKSLAKEGIIGGLPLRRFYPELDKGLLIYVNEMVSAHKAKRLVEVISS